MFKNVLVGLDGSRHALAATRKGAALAALTGARLHLVTITKPFKVSAELKRYLQAEQLLGEPQYVLDEMTGQIVDEAKDIVTEAGVQDIKTAVREGKAARTLVEYAKRNAVDLIVLGSRGVGESEAALLGSISHKVSMLAPCTVMIVKE